MSSFHDFNRNLIKDIREHGKATSGPFLGKNVLILTTTGARSGEGRENVVMYSQDDGRQVVVASKGGAPHHPSWYHNLKKHPIVTVEAGGEKFKARARAVDGEDYERLYRLHADPNPQFWEYRKKTTRRIPVVVLERMEPAKRA